MGYQSHYWPLQYVVCQMSDWYCSGWLSIVLLTITVCDLSHKQPSCSWWLTLLIYEWSDIFMVIFLFLNLIKSLLTHWQEFFICTPDVNFWGTRVWLNETSFDPKKVVPDISRPKHFDAMLMHWLSVKSADNFQIRAHSWLRLFHINYHQIFVKWVVRVVPVTYTVKHFDQYLIFIHTRYNMMW